MNMGEYLKEGGFQRWLLIWGWEMTHIVLQKDVTNVIRMQIGSAAEDKGIHFHPCPHKGGERNVYERMGTPFSWGGLQVEAWQNDGT